LYVSEDQLIEWHEQNRSNSAREIERAAEMYCFKNPLKVRDGERGARGQFKNNGVSKKKVSGQRSAVSGQQPKAECRLLKAER